MVDLAEHVGERFEQLRSARIRLDSKNVGARLLEEVAVRLSGVLATGHQWLVARMSPSKEPLRITAMVARSCVCTNPVVARVNGQTYVLLGPSVFGVTVQQDPLSYHATRLADGAVAGQWRYDYWEAGQQTTFSGPVTCLAVSGNRAWVGGPITESSDPTQVGMGAWWQVADNGAGWHPVIPDRTTFVGIGTIAQTIAYCAGEPAPHFIFDVQLGGVQVEDSGSAS